METEKKFVAPVILPMVPSQLIRMAIEDIEACEKAEGVEIDMLDWHNVRKIYSGGKVVKEVCSLCAAGATMRQRLNVPDDQNVFPQHCTGNTRQLNAIDALRKGWAADAVTVHLELVPGYPDEARKIAKLSRDIPEYDEDPELFKSAMRQFADDLEAAGY